MSEELIRRLKNLATLDVATQEIYGGARIATTSAEAIECIQGLAQEAADAIEELQKLTDAQLDIIKQYQVYLPKWISVTEKPPLKVGDDGYNGYLVYANGYYEVADYTTDKFDNIPYFHVEGEYEPNVTHYMPLPKPPKEG